MSKEHEITIDIKELKEEMNFLLEELARRSEKVRVIKDYYWSVADEDLYSMEGEPRKLEVGSIIDEYRFSRLAGRDASLVVPQNLCQITPLLYYVGQVLAGQIEDHQDN